MPAPSAAPAYRRRSGAGITSDRRPPARRGRPRRARPPCGAPFSRESATRRRGSGRDRRASPTSTLFDQHRGGLLLGVVVAERPEVVHAREARRRIVHRLDVEWLLDPPDVTAWRTPCAAGQPDTDSCARPRRGARESGAAPSLSTSMLMSAGSASLTRRGMSRAARRLRLEVRHLHQRMHARIGAARSLTLEVRTSRCTSAIARSSSPCTVRAFFCFCQPLYRVPAYSSVSLNRAITNSAGLFAQNQSRNARAQHTAPRLSALRSALFALSIMSP